MRCRQMPWAILVVILAIGVPGVQAQNDSIAPEPDEFAVMQKIYDTT